MMKQFSELKNVHFNNVNHINNNSFILNTSRDSNNSKGGFATGPNKKLSVSIMEQALTDRNKDGSLLKQGINNPYLVDSS